MFKDQVRTFNASFQNTKEFSLSQKGKLWIL